MITRGSGLSERHLLESKPVEMLPYQPDHVLVALGQPFLLLHAGVWRRALGGRQPVIRGGEQPVGVHCSRGGGRGLSVPAGQLRLLSSGPVGLHVIKGAYSGGSARLRAVIETDGRALVGGWERRRREASWSRQQTPRSLLLPPPPNLGFSSAGAAKLHRFPSRRKRQRRPEFPRRRCQSRDASQARYQRDYRHGSYRRSLARSLARSMLLLLFVREQLQVHYGRRSVRDDVTGGVATTLSSLESHTQQKCRLQV